MLCFLKDGAELWSDWTSGKLCSRMGWRLRLCDMRLCSINGKTMSQPLLVAAPTLDRGRGGTCTMAAGNTMWQLWWLGEASQSSSEEGAQTMAPSSVKRCMCWRTFCLNLGTKRKTQNASEQSLVAIRREMLWIATFHKTDLYIKVRALSGTCVMNQRSTSGFQWEPSAVRGLSLSLSPSMCTSPLSVRLHPYGRHLGWDQGQTECIHN